MTKTIEIYDRTAIGIYGVAEGLETAIHIIGDNEHSHSELLSKLKLELARVREKLMARVYMRLVRDGHFSCNLSSDEEKRFSGITIGIRGDCMTVTMDFEDDEE